MGVSAHKIFFTLFIKPVLCVSKFLRDMFAPQAYTP